MSEIEVKQFKVLCNLCDKPAVVQFWAGSHGDSGYLYFNCPDCGALEHVED